MAIAIRTHTGNSNGPDPSITIAADDLAVGAGANLTTSETIDSATLGGVAMTTADGGSPPDGVRAFFLANPDVSPGTGARTFAPSVSGGTLQGRAILAITGADEASPVRGTDNPGGSGAGGQSVTIATVAGDLVLAFVRPYGGSDGIAVSAESGTELLFSDNDGGSAIGFACLYKTATGTSTTLNFALNQDRFWLAHVVVIKAASSDVTPPELSSPAAAATGPTTADLSVDSDEDVDAYVVVTPSSTTPTHTQIKAGQDHTGAAAAYDDVEFAASAGTINFTGATGLAPATTYYPHFTAEDAAANAATPVTGSSFTTPANWAALTLALRPAG